MDSFIAILNEVNSRSSGQLVERLHQFFCDITTLQNEDELIAAYQTVMTLKESSPTPEHPLFEQARKAIVAQMQVEIYKYMPEYRFNKIERFAQVTGETFKESSPNERQP
jgi:hypothetical protein